MQHHAAIHLTNMRTLLHLEETFGKHLPDVPFIFTTSDTPRHVSPTIVNTSHPTLPSGPVPGMPSTKGARASFAPPPYPIMGICKSDFWPDLLLVPNFHFYNKNYDNTSLGAIPEYARIPWEERKEVLFGRFTDYQLHRVPRDRSTMKLGIGGKADVCRDKGVSCPTRTYFMERVATKNPGRIDVSAAAKRPLLHHASIKYLANMEGQGISSRLEQLLPIGSLVFKEASGYYAYYYRTLLKPGVNMLEFWAHGSGPEDVLEKLDWARENDDKARRIAAAGVKTAATYLTANGRACYWYRLLHGLSRSLAYTPSLDQWPQAQPLREVVAELEARRDRDPWVRDVVEEPWAP
ncbi:hypothetical protein HYH03_005916 [Edaphochlamys debaryana]|uniref:Glycosyl transferase CAP10 domain-containing protein n=1 Tax=Edaphochlamys debaryana TaxID=47281 RepID=A0A835Y3W6_9CHLO|nr:hypothetical protein HYH03_005916 [Edaphochlamys debaryana]|eukprot:KAG2495992.1 hypothetical protein HYH03_005916 [Edaphochlamys debaryana]